MPFFGKWNRPVLALTAAASLFAVSAGCSKNPESSSAPADTAASAPSAAAASPASKAKGTVTFWHDKTGVMGDSLNAAAAKFQEAHPEWKVESVYVADLTVGGGQKLMTSVLGGQAPDVVFFDRFQIASWADQEALVDITDRVAADKLDSSRFYPSSWNEVVYKKKVYGVPVSTDGRVLFYNKEHFKAAGLDPEKPPKTIRELEEAAAKLTVKEGNAFKRIGFAPWQNQGNFYTWGWVFGGSFYDEATGKVTANDPKLVEALQWLQDYAAKYDPVEVKSLASSTQVDAFVAGNSSMVVSNNLLAATIKANNPGLNYGVAEIPTPGGDRTVTWSGGYSLVIPKGAKNPDGAWELMRYFTQDEGQEFVTRFHLSVVPSVNQKVFANDPASLKVMSMLSQSKWRPVIPQGQLLWNELANAMDMAINNKGKPQQLLDDVTAKVNTALQKK